MEAEEEFLQNATTMLRFAEEEIKQFLAWTGKRSPYSRPAEELKTKLQTAASDLKNLKKEYSKRPSSNSYGIAQPLTAFGGIPATE
ncbi:hypothetical protein [Hymenobacter sp.]|jgi:hypothetical protein|uniref:hypothetical protein n=1 Tax=Hymenobacter sp. TaxID=1898978 RepID=UPI002ED9AC58